MTEGSAAVTVANIFTQAGETMSGIMKMTGDFFGGLWDNPMGKIVITLGVVSGAIGLCRKLFLGKKKI